MNDEIREALLKDELYSEDELELNQLVGGINEVTPNATIVSCIIGTGTIISVTVSLCPTTKCTKQCTGLTIC